MSDARERISARIAALESELSKIPAHVHNSERIDSRRRGLAALKAQLERVEKMSDRFVEQHARLLARCDQFASMPRGR